MVLDQRPLGLTDCLLDRMKLLGDIEAGSAGLDHFDDALEVPIGALQPLDDLGVGFVDVKGFVHGLDTIPLERI